MDSQLANLTVSMVLTLAYLVAVCWIVPVIPMVIALVYGWPFTAFLAVWLIGLSISSYAFYCFFKRKR